MTVDELKAHLDKRLDAQDLDRRVLGEKIGKVQIHLAVVENSVKGQKEACEAKHNSSRKRLNRIEGGFIALGATAVFACWEYAKKKVTGGGG